MPTAFGVRLGFFKSMPPCALPVELLYLPGFSIPEMLFLPTLMYVSLDNFVV